MYAFHLSIFYGPYQGEMYPTPALPARCQVLTSAESSAWKEISHDRKPSSLLGFYSFKSERLFKCNLRGNAWGQLERQKKMGTSGKGMALNSTSALDVWIYLLVLYFLYWRREENAL